MDLDHEGVLATNNRAVTHGEVWKVGLDFEANGAAVAGANVSLESTGGHVVGALRANAGAHPRPSARRGGAAG